MCLSPQKYKLFSNFPHSFSTTSPTTLFHLAKSHILRKNAEGYHDQSHILRKNAEGYRARGRNRRWRVYQLRRYTDVRAEILFVYQKRIPIFVVLFGAWAGRLGTGLQNQVERFNSARHLRNAFHTSGRRFLIYHLRHRERATALGRITLHRRLRVTGINRENGINPPPKVEGYGGKGV